MRYFPRALVRVILLIAQLPHLTGDAQTTACTVLTGQNLGTDTARWQAWWKAQPR